MSPEEQRIAIAKAVGWKAIDGVRHIDPDSKIWLRPGDNGDDYHTHRRLPDYLHSLDACHEMEKGLTGAECLEYEKHLNAATKHMKHITAFPMIHATAAQKCEAFLRAKNLWKESR